MAKNRLQITIFPQKGYFTVFKPVSIDLFSQEYENYSITLNAEKSVETYWIIAYPFIGKLCSLVSRDAAELLLEGSLPSSDNFLSTNTGAL